MPFVSTGRRRFAISRFDIGIMRDSNISSYSLGVSIHRWHIGASNSPAVPIRALAHCSSPTSDRDLFGGMCRVSISRHLSKQLKEIGARESATLFMVLLSAFDVLSYRYTGQVAIVIASVTAGRNYPELEKLVGFNTAVPRVI